MCTFFKNQAILLICFVSIVPESGCCKSGKKGQGTKIINMRTLIWAKAGSFGPLKKMFADVYKDRYLRCAQRTSNSFVLKTGKKEKVGKSRCGDDIFERKNLAKWLKKSY